MATAMSMSLTTLTVMTVAIKITTVITAGKDAAIAADVGMALVVVAATAAKTASMTIIVDCQEQAELCVTKISVDNNTNSYFSYNSQTHIFYFSIYLY